MVKIPAQAAREIDMEASRLGIFKYEVVLRAWECYKLAAPQTGLNALPAKDIPPVPLSHNIQHGTVRTPSTGQQESPWVQDLLAILESGHQVAMQAIQSNLKAFRELVERSHEPHTDADRGAGSAEVSKLIADALRVDADAEQIDRDAEKTLADLREGADSGDPIPKRSRGGKKKAG